MITVFDLDHTLFTTNCSFKFGVYLYRRRIMTQTSMLYLVACYFLHKIGILSLPNLHRSIFERYFRHRSLEEIEEQAAVFLNENFHSLTNPFVEERLRYHQRRGDRIYLVSSSPQFLVKPISKRFGIDEWYSTQYHVDARNKFCNVTEVDGKKKMAFITTEAARLQIPLSKITAFSDSSLDLPLLETVGNVVAVNPDRALRKKCKKNNWEILEGGPHV